MDYEFKTPPFAHQREAFNLSRDKASFALLMEMGTGKSKVAIDTAAYLYTTGKIDAVLVLGNKGSYRNWVDTQVPAHLPDDIPRYVTYWDSAASKGLRDTYEDILRPGNFLRVLAMNIEALPFRRSLDLAVSFARNYRTLIVVDESTTVKNPTAARTKAAIKLAALCPYRRIMTGEPITNSPLDLYAQCQVLGPNMLGFVSYFTFKARFADMVQISAGGRSFKKITGYKNLDDLTKRLATFSYRVRKEDCLDLPPKVYLTHRVDLTDEQKDLYDKLREESMAELEGGLVTAPLVITRLLRLHQLTCGHLVDDAGVSHEIPTNRIDALGDVLDETSGKVIIWATYRADIRAIRASIAAKYGPDSVVEYYGDTDSDARSQGVTQFQDMASPVRFFVGNPRTGGFGITLTAASTVVYYSNNYDLEIRLQSEDRAHRIGQTKSVTYVDLVAHGTVDEKIITALRGKRKLATEVLGDAWRAWI